MPSAGGKKGGVLEMEKIHGKAEEYAFLLHSPSLGTAAVSRMAEEQERPRLYRPVLWAVHLFVGLSALTCCVDPIEPMQ